MSVSYSMFSIYEEIYHEVSSWNASSCYIPRFTIYELFSDDGETAQKFVAEYLRKLDKERIIKNSKDYLLDSFNSVHTLSAFFFGIFLKKALNITMPRLPKMYERDENNFAYFWMLACLCHDVARSIEKSSIKSIEDFYTKNYIRYKFLCKTNDRKLFEAYLNYWISEEREDEQKADHGILGAIILYDAMMKRFNNAKRSKCKKVDADGSGFTFGGLHFSENFQNNMFMAANSIAHHDIWRVNPNSTDERDKVRLKDYPGTELECLIAKDDSCKIFIDKSSSIVKSDIDSGFLFLLALTDSLEPIKASDSREISDIINTIKVSVLDNTITFECGKYYNKFVERVEGIENFLNVELEQLLDSRSIKVSILK